LVLGDKQTVIYEDKNVKVTKNDYIINIFELAQKNHKLIVYSNSNLKVNDTLGKQMWYPIVLDYGNNSLIIKIDKTIVISDWFYRKPIENINILDNLTVIAIVIIIIGVAIYSLKTWYYYDM